MVYFRYIIVGFLFISLFNGTIQAQEPGASDEASARIKSLYIYNYTKDKYVSWPEGSVDDTFDIAVFEDKLLFDALSELEGNKQALNRPLKIHNLSVSDSVIPTIDLIYVHHDDIEDPSLLMEVAIENNILIVGEEYNFSDVMITFVVQNNKWMFAVSEPKMKKAKLKVSNTLLSLAIMNEKEWSNALEYFEEVLESEEGEITVEKEDLEKLVNDYKEVEKKIESALKELGEEKKALTALKWEIATKERELEDKSSLVAKQNDELIEIRDAIKSKEAEVLLKEEELKENEAKLNELTSEAKVIQRVLDSNQMVLDEQLSKIENQKNRLDEQGNEITEQKGLIENQQMTIYIAIGFSAVLAILGYFIFRSYSEKRKANIAINKQKEEIEEQKEMLEIKNEEILDSINYAKRIQSAILPPAKLVKEYLDQSFILYKPKDIVAGDFYWMEHKDNKVLFAAADCTGHGVPGAMVSVVCVNGLNRSVREYGLTDPGKILDKTREIVIQEFEKSEEDVKDGMDISLIAMEGNTIQWAGANNPIWIIRNGEMLETKPDKQPIGKYDMAKPFTTHSIELEKADTIYIFTDGFADQFGGEKGKKFKAANFKRLLLSIQDKSMEEQRILIDEAFETWRGSIEQIDDVCVIGVRV